MSSISLISDLKVRLCVLLVILVCFFFLGDYSKAAFASTANWNNEIRLTDNSSDSTLAPANGWTIGTDSFNIVHVVWSDNQRGYYEIYYKHSLDGGFTWENELRITNNEATDARAPSLAVSPNGFYVHVIWVDQRSGIWQIYYGHSNDGGETFAPEILLEPNPVSFEGASICNGGNGIINILYKRWIDPGKWQIFNIYSLDNGNTFSTGQQITEVDSYKENPVCAIDSNGHVYVVWQDTRDDMTITADPDNLRREIYFKRSLDGGNTWEPDVRLTYDVANGSADPSIAVDRFGKVHVVWHDDRDGNWEIFYKQSPDRGVTWSDDIQLTFRGNPDYDPETVETDLPSIAVDDDGVVRIVWQDKSESNISKIFYKQGDGVTWEPEVVISDEPSKPSVAPSIAVSSDYVHVIWQRKESSTNYDLYYRSRPFLPFYECNFVPGTTIIPRGGTLAFQATVTNNTDEVGIVLFGTKATKPDGTKTGYLIGPLEISLEPYQSKSGYISHKIPLGAPIGTYIYHGYVGRRGVGIYDECQFNFEVIQ